MASGKSRPSDQTARLLFGSASRCAFPNCTTLLIHRFGEIMTISVEIAHIRSDKPRGPRHVPGYETVHEFENLLLLCPTHHKMVEDNPDTFPIEMLEGWKETQVGQIGTDLSDDLVAALRQQISALNEAVAALTGAAPALTATVQVLAGRGDGGGAVMMPLDAYRRTTFPAGTPMPYLGVEVRGHGQLPVRQAGLEFDLGEVAPAAYLMPSEIQHRDEQHEVRLIDHDRLRASMLELAKITLRLPLRFRGFVQLGDWRQVSGVWTPMLELPIWRNEITEEDLQRLQRPRPRPDRPTRSPPRERSRGRLREDAGRGCRPPRGTPACAQRREGPGPSDQFDLAGRGACGDPGERLVLGVRRRNRREPGAWPADGGCGPQRPPRPGRLFRPHRGRRLASERAGLCTAGQ